MTGSSQCQKPTTFEKSLKKFLAIEGVSLDEAMQFAIAQERSRLLSAANSSEPAVASVLRSVASALKPLLTQAQWKVTNSPAGTLDIHSLSLDRCRRRSGKYNREERSPMLAELIASGLPLAEAARRIGIPYGVAYGWAKSEGYGLKSLQAKSIPGTPAPPPT
jgi:hypothetical protein